MLSRKVTCAIMILNELYCTRSDEKMGRKMLRRTTLAENCNMESSIFRKVIQQLYLNKYIDVVNVSIILIRNPAETTIYELFELFHGGIPIGEEVEQQVDLYTERRHHKIALLEEDVAWVSRKYFERKTVASMISGRRTHSKQHI